MTALWTAADAQAATGGSGPGGWTATGVSIDTRTLVPGDLFVALTDVRDGHDFVAQALDKGAAAALVSRVPEGVPADAPLLVVPDVLEGLRGLARAARARTGARVLAITGSVGKTSAKEMARAALSAQGRTHAAEASYNNHWGVPLTLARMPADTAFAVIEIGMSNPGEITPLSRLARPDVALITTVAPAHLASFESIEGIAHEKASLMDGLTPGQGIAILNADIATTPILVYHARALGVERVLFGTAGTADWRLGQVQQTEDSVQAQAQAGDLPILFKLGGPGAHHAMNALGVLAACKALGADLVRAVLGLSDWVPPEGRGTRERLVLDPDDDAAVVTLIDDAFNANPASLAAALDVFAQVQPRDGQGNVIRGRRVAILGDMLELGPTEAQLHADLARHPAMERIALVHCVGPRMRHLWDALPEDRRGQRVEAVDDLLPVLKTLIRPGDILLVKGSKGSKVSRAVDALRKLGQATQARTTGGDNGQGAE